jgi:hypothetical protein
LFNIRVVIRNLYARSLLKIQLLKAVLKPFVGVLQMLLLIFGIFGVRVKNTELRVNC